MDNRLIAFAGRKRSGKGLMSNAIVEYNNDINQQTKILTIASYLKELCCALLGITHEMLTEWKDNGYTFSTKPNDRWFNIINKKTQIPIEIIKNKIADVEFTNIRQMLQVIGTDLIRNYNPNWHVECLIADIQDYLKFYNVVIDDVRFPNEKEAIEKIGGQVFFIIRPNYFDVSNHISETSLKWQNFKEDRVIINDLSKESMELNIKLAYANNFNIKNIPIFLSSNIYYKDCYNANFPIRNSDLLQDLLHQCLNDERFKQKGILHYHSLNRKLIAEFNNEILFSECNNWRKDFILYNPLINENLKFYVLDEKK